jgi:DNA-binding transcriptional LysR family regulator
MRGSDYAELRALLTVAKHRSFARAAAELGISRSALSQTIQSLERRLGVRLLNRTTRSVAPSEAGSVLLDQLIPLFAQLDEAVASASVSTSGVTGTLRINAPRMAIIHELAPLVAPFLAAHPQVKLDIVADDRLVDIVGEGFDAGVRLGEAVEKDMIAVKLGGKLRMVVVASPAYLDRFGRPETPRDLREHRCINLRRPTDRSIYRWEFERGGECLEVLLDGALLVDEPAIALRAMLDGVGIAYLFEHVVGAAIAAGTAIPLLEDWSPPFPGLYLYYPSRHTAPPLRAFIELLRQQSLAPETNQTFRD